MKKLATLSLVMLMLLSLLLGCGGNPNGAASQTQTGSDVKQTLTVLNWGDYIDEELLDVFKSEYPNITIDYQVVPNNEEMLVLLEQGGYDVAFPSDYIIERLIQKDMLAPIDHAKITNFDGIIDFCKDQAFDPGNEYSIPYMWGTLGILYNKTMVDEPVDSWNILWDEKYEKKIYMYDSIRDSMTVALKKLGYDVNTRVESEIEAAGQALIDQKPLVLAYLGDPVKDKMISENAALAVVYSGDAAYCMMENENLDYIVPKEGSNLWFDNMVIMKESQSVEAAHLFIDFLCRDDVALQNTEYIGYTTPVQNAYDNVPEELKNNAYMPREEDIENCEIFHDLGDTLEIYNKIWIKVKSVAG